MTEESTTSSVPVPMFDGKAESWIKFSKKFSSLAARKGCGIVLALGPTDTIEQDDVTLSDTVAGDVKKDKIRKANATAAGLLLSCMDTSTKLGDFAFDLVQEYRIGALPDHRNDPPVLPARQLGQPVAGIRVAAEDQHGRRGHDSS